MTWHQDYEAAWAQIDLGLGGLGGQHLGAARALVGDVALLQLMRLHGPGTVIVACGVELVRLVVRDPPFADEGHVEREVRLAHERLVACEGDVWWRRVVSPGAEQAIRNDVARLRHPAIDVH